MLTVHMLTASYVLGSSPDFTARAATTPPGERGNYSSARFDEIVQVRPLRNNDEEHTAQNTRFGHSEGFAPALGHQEEGRQGQQDERPSLGGRRREGAEERGIYRSFDAGGLPAWSWSW